MRQLWNKDELYYRLARFKKKLYMWHGGIRAALPYW
jgi:hypothetical protein